MVFTQSALRKHLHSTLEKNKIIKFREEEIEHKDIAYEQGATREGFYFLFDKIVKTGSKIAINISKKI